MASLISLTAVGSEAPICVEKMTFGLGDCRVYLAKAALAQHHEEVEVVDSHSDFCRAGDSVDGWTGWQRGRGQGRRERFRQRDRYCLRQSGRCGIWLRLLESRSGRIGRWMTDTRARAHTYVNTYYLLLL